MFKRVFSCLLLIVFCSSCEFFTANTKENKIQLDTIVNFTSVDVSPSFSECDSLINAKKKRVCFRNTLHQKLALKLSKHHFTTKDSINATILVRLILSKKGKITLKNIESSDAIKHSLPKLDSVIESSVLQLPTIYPAIKRGIPVTTQYQIPIEINLQ